MTERRDDPIPDDPTWSDPSWITRVRAGDATAFQAIFRAFYDPLIRFATRLTHSEAVAEELVQEVFWRIWERHPEWTVRDSIRVYLYTAVRNQAFNHLRHEAIVERSESADPIPPGTPLRQPSAHEQLIANELDDAIHRAIDRLAPRSREAYLLQRQHDLTYAEIGQVMGTSEKTVKEQIARALKSIRRDLETWGFWERL